MMSHEETVKKLRELRDGYSNPNTRVPGWDGVARSKAVKIWMKYHYGDTPMEDPTGSFIDLLIEELDTRKSYVVTENDAVRAVFSRKHNARAFLSAQMLKKPESNWNLQDYELDVMGAP